MFLVSTVSCRKEVVEEPVIEKPEEKLTVEEPVEEESVEEDQAIVEEPVKEEVVAEEPVEEAEPLLNGIIVENLSIALTKIKRKQDYWDSKIDHICLDFTLRKIKTSGESNLKFSFEIIDDHGNIYDENNMSLFYGPDSGETKIGPNLGRYDDTYCQDANIDIDKAPIGFTWTVPLRSFEIPSSAPLTKLKIYYQKGYRDEKKELTTIDLSNFKPSPVEDFYSQLKDENLLFLPYTFKKEYLSMTIQKMQIKEGKEIQEGVSQPMDEREAFIIPITFINDDYNSINFSLEGIGIQNPNGAILWGYYTGYEGGTLPGDGGFTASIPELSQKTTEFHIIRFSDEGTPKAILFYSLPGKASDNITILKISPENFE